MNESPAQPPKPSERPAVRAPATAGAGTHPAKTGPPARPTLGPVPAQAGPMPNLALRSPVRIGPPDPTLWQRAWVLREAAAGRAALVGALVAAIVAAVAVPVDRPGIGWPIAGIGLVAPLAVLQARRRRAEALLWCCGAAGLLSVGLFRAAGWLFALCALTAFGCVAMAVGRPRRVPGVLYTPFALLMAVFRAVPWAGAGLSAIKPSTVEGAADGSPEQDEDDDEDEQPHGDRGVRLLVSIGIGVLLLVVFGALFASADAAFGRVVGAIVPSLDAGTVSRWVFVGLAAAGVSLGAAFLVANPSSVGDGAPRSGRPVRRIEWLVPVGAVLALFVLFVAVQLTVLFGDRGYVMRTVGLTFAQYARKGFWQLLVITLLTLLVMGVTARKAPRASRADRSLLRLVLGLLALCSLVVVGSALWRMNVYEQAYGFTRLRVFVSAFELWLGGLFGLVLLAGLAGAGRRATWLGRAAAGLWVVTLLGLAVLNPDRFIAAHNVDRANASNSDIWYLRSLSADAAPELDRLPSGARECALSDIDGDLRQRPDDWRGWNLSRSRARQLLSDPIRVGDFPCYRRY
ncbi:DUF4173 domain-containing protein [Dactylosporangium sp. NPDC051485]|uniref:DUF4153 domain-containing protein n=1 Tax=Dactylosporangium sp. NPDC051485 TaxID=3154846 RepID=UPI00341A1802